MTTPSPDTPVEEETLERSCLMCDEVRRIVAQVGPIAIKEPCPCKCGPGYFEPPGRTVRRPGKDGN